MYMGYASWLDHTKDHHKNDTIGLLDACVRVGV